MNEPKTFSKFDEKGQLITNIERWQSIHTESRKWRGRYRLIAKHILPGESVIESGCGDMALRKYLHPNSAYQPSDLIARNDDCLVIDLNKDLPENLQTRYSVAVFAGVLEYVGDVDKVLSWSLRHADRVCFSYATIDDFPDMDRRSKVYGWFNHLSRHQIIEIGSKYNDCRIKLSERWNRQDIFTLSVEKNRKASAPSS